MHRGAPVTKTVAHGTPNILGVGYGVIFRVHRIILNDKEQEIAISRNSGTQLRKFRINIRSQVFNLNYGGSFDDVFFLSDQLRGVCRKLRMNL